jgi:Na+/H+ antiporter NhaC
MNMKIIIFSICFLFSFFSPLVIGGESSYFSISPPKVVLKGIEFSLELKPSILLYNEFAGNEVPYSVISMKNQKVLASGKYFVDPANPSSVSISEILTSQSGINKINVTIAENEKLISISVIPAILSILPPLLAILLALITRQVIVALFFGIWLGVTFLYGFHPLLGFLHTVDEYIVQGVYSRDHIFILIFSLALGGMVGVITRSGGTQGIVEILSKYAKDSRRGQLATWAMGVFIFFDDYANTLIVGNTMRPLTDKLKISREKLSYLVDSTAAPVANIAIISTWIGYELGLFNQAFVAMNLDLNPYLIFIQSIPFNFYPLYSLLLGLFVALLLRDFGPMWKAERRTITTGEVLSPTATPLSDVSAAELAVDKDTPKRWYNAFVPVIVVIAVVINGLLYTGYKNLMDGGGDLSQMSFIRKMSEIVGNADSFSVLSWGAFSGSIVAIIMALGQRILTLHQALDAWVMGIRSMMMAVLILVCAWAIGSICQDLYTADYVVHLAKNFLSPNWLPLLIFLSSGVIAFSTGTSWGTMAILMPIAIPLAYKLPLNDASIDPPHAMALLLSSTAAVLAGATFGDHCSPISDTTIMSSMASGADHIDHVRTQMPYALTAGLVACVAGYIPVGMGFSNWIVLPLGALIIFLIVRFVGKNFL